MRAAIVSVAFAGSTAASSSGALQLSFQERQEQLQEGQQAPVPQADEQLKRQLAAAEAEDDARRGVDGGAAEAPRKVSAGLMREEGRLASEFGAQGEGAIAGRWFEYRVSDLGEHRRFRFSRLQCAAG